MPLEIRQHAGYCAGKLIDTGLDAVWEVDPRYPKGRRIAFADRRPGAPLQLIERVSEAIVADAQRLLDDRDFGDLDETKQAIARGQREVQHPPEIVDEGVEDE